MFYIVLSPLNQPYQNFALEETIFELMDENSMYLLFYQNIKSVIIGRHQNPVKEANLHYLKENNILLSRRISGGGTVFHDINNLNFSFITSSNNFSINNNFDLILTSLKQFGIEAEVKNKIDLYVKNKKISGNSFFYKGNKRIHHGTILVNSNLEILKKSLAVKNTNIESNSINSRISEVANLSEFKSNITLEDVRDSLIDNFISKYPNTKLKTYEEIIIDDLYSDLLKKYKSFEWNYCKTPKFTLNGRNIDPSKWKLKSDAECLI